MLDVIPHIVVEVASSQVDIAAHWRDLTSRANANVFMNPAVTNAALATGFATTCVLTAWDRTTNIAKLLGVWALRKTNASPLGPSLLSAPPYEYSFVSSPVVDRARMDDVIPAFFEAIVNDPSLPKVIRLRYLDGGSETYPAILKALAARGSRQLILAESQRAFALPDAGVKLSGSTRKKLRQDWNRLSAEGTATVVNDRAPTAVVAAFEMFLAFEAASWKSGTALLAHADSAAFARKAIADLAADNGASVALLTVGGTPIAAQVLLYSGRTAYTWKTAFDPDHGRHSPGALLVDRITSELLASGDIDAIESCSPHGGFMTQLWTGRRATVDLLVDLGTSPSLAFAIVALRTRGRAAMKVVRDRLRARWSSWRQRRRVAAAGAP